MVKKKKYTNSKKAYWWGDETNQACEIYFHKSADMPEEEREKLFVEKIYPQLKILAVGNITRLANRISRAKYDSNRDLIDGMISYAVEHLFNYDKKKGAAWSSYANIFMGGYISNVVSKELSIIAKNSVLMSQIENNDSSNDFDYECLMNHEFLLNNESRKRREDLIEDIIEEINNKRVSILAVYQISKHEKVNKAIDIICDMMRHPEQHGIHHQRKLTGYIAGKSGLNQNNIVKLMTNISRFIKAKRYGTEVVPYNKSSNKIDRKCLVCKKNMKVYSFSKYFTCVSCKKILREEAKKKRIVRQCIHCGDDMFLKPLSRYTVCHKCKQNRCKNWKEKNKLDNNSGIFT